MIIFDKKPIYLPCFVSYSHKITTFYRRKSYDKTVTNPTRMSGGAAIYSRPLECRLRLTPETGKIPKFKKPFLLRPFPPIFLKMAAFT